MRVVDHQAFNSQRQNRARSKKLGVIAVGSVVSGVLIALFLYKFNTVAPPAGDQRVATSSVSSANVNSARTDDTPPSFFSGDQFQDLYEDLAFPNTEPILQPPSITGNSTADKRIQQIAESRGYVLRSSPLLPLVKTNEPRLAQADDDLLQPKAYKSWLKLEKSAQKAGIPIQLNSGFRSIESQRKLFLERLSGMGVSVASIANGTADAGVVTVLSKAAPPGYSRHHTGYTIDLYCNDGIGGDFDKTICFQWLKADNYKNAKSAGWVPSYPEGADDQGPEPESWEYVWVGEDLVYE